MNWTRLSQPATHVQGAEQRRQSALLAALVIGMIPCIILIVIAWVLITQTTFATNSEAGICLLAAASLLVPYALARQGRYKLGAVVTIVSLSLALYTSAVPTTRPSELRLLMWLVIPIFLSSVFLSIRQTLIVVGCVCLALLAFPLLVPGIPLEAVAPGPFGFIVFMSVLIIVFTHHRNQLEADRRTELLTRDILLSAVTDGMLDVISQIDPQGTVLYLSSSFKRLAGYDHTAYIGKPFPRHLVHPDDQPEMDHIMQATWQTGNPALFEYRFRHADGHYIWLETSGHVLDMAGQGQRGVLVTRDVTQRREAQEQLKQQNELLQTIFDTIPVMIALYDHDLNFRLVNREFTRALGWTLEQAQSGEMQSRSAPDPAERHQIARRMRDGVPGWNDNQTITADGHVLDTSWADMKLSDGSGIAIGQDITARKAAEALLHRSHDELERQVAARTAELTDANTQLQDQIRQREQAERRLLEEHTLIRTLFDILPDHLFVKDRESRFLLANAPIVRSINATSLDALIGKTDFDFSPPEIAQEFYDDEQAVIQTGVALVNKEEPAIDWAGEVRWFLTTKVPLVDSAGQITGIVGVARDITARKQAEAELRRLNEELEQRVDQRTAELTDANAQLEAEIRERKQAEATLKELADALEQQARTLDEVLSATPDLFAMFDREGRFLYINPPALRMLGLTAEEAHRQLWRDLDLPPSFSAGFGARLERVFATGRVDTLEQRMEIGGSPRAFESILSPIHDLNGNVVYAVMTNRDVTERKRIESALRESEERYRIVSESISDYAYSYKVAADGTILGDWTTESFTRVTGYPVESDINRGSYSLYYPDDAERAQRDVQLVLQNQSLTSEYRIIRKDGVMRWLRIHRKPVWDDREGRVVQYYGVATDITEEKNTERERIRMALEHERLSLMSRFVLAVSHDFRTSLANIETSRYLISRTLDQTDLDRVSAKLTTIHECVDHLTTQLENFSTVSFLANPNLRLCDVNPLISLLAADHERLAQERRITLAVSLADDLPGVYADEDELKRALRHMIMNALNYTLAGGHIDLRTYATEKQVAIEVRDTGVGIAPDHLGSIFELFYRADPARAIHSGGVGLGLSIVKMVAEAHSGRVMVESEAGKGSTFTLVLPIAQPDVTRI